jgi:hypothetical protein
MDPPILLVKQSRPPAMMTNAVNTDLADLQAWAEASQRQTPSRRDS